MSKWYTTKIEDMRLSPDSEELDIYIDSDEWGAVYVSVKLEDIKKLIVGNKEEETKTPKK